MAELYGARAAELGWAPGARARTTRSGCGGRCCCARWSCTARDPDAVAEAEKRLPAAGAGAGDVDPNLLDVVVTAAARGADEARFEDLRARARSRDRSGQPSAATCTRWRASRRRRSPRAPSSWRSSDDVPMQDFSSYVGVLLGNRATREAAFALIRDRWTETRAKADSPMILRRLVEALAALPERRHYDEVRAFLEAHPIDGAKQAIAQTLERMQMDATLRDRILPRVGAWLRAR